MAIMDNETGFLDPIDGLIIRGWALPDERVEETALVDIFIDSVLVTRLRAKAYRADLEARGYQDGFAAFAFEIPMAYRDGEPHVVDVRRAGTDESLRDSPVSFTFECRSIAKLREKRRWAARNLVFEAASSSQMASSVKRTRKLAIISTYHEAQRHLGYHRIILRSLSDAGFTVLVVHAANTHRTTLADTDVPNCFTILKRNIGYDFGSYAIGIFAVCDLLPHVDELVMMNDSVLQITNTLTPVIAKMRAAGADAVSCTDSFEHHYHLQSYMVWFGQKICQSGCLPRFMADYSFTSIKEDVITEGEIGLSRRLQQEGFTITALYAYQTVATAWTRRYLAIARQIAELPGLPIDSSGASFKKSLMERLDLLVNLVLSGKPLNQSHFFWDTLVEEFDCPFIKRELIVANPCNVPTYYKLGGYFPPARRRSRKSWRSATSMAERSCRRPTAVADDREARRFLGAPVGTIGRPAHASRLTRAQASEPSARSLVEDSGERLPCRKT